MTTCATWRFESCNRVLVFNKSGQNTKLMRVTERSQDRRVEPFVGQLIPEISMPFKTDRIAYLFDSATGGDAALTSALSTLGIRVRPFGWQDPRPGGFADCQPGCVLFDADGGDWEALSIFSKLRADYPALPIVVVSSSADTTTVITAMRIGACDFLVKPLDREALAASLDPIFNRLARRTEAYWRQRAIKARLDLLSDREQEILGGLLAGQANKTLAHALGISVRTVEMHRANLMTKLGVHSFAEAIRLTVDAGVAPAGTEAPLVPEAAAPGHVIAGIAAHLLATNRHPAAQARS